MATIAFCGLGKMGVEMATRLRSAGHDMRVWNRSPEKASAWAQGGGTACASAEEAGRGASAAHLMLADDAAVEATIFGPHGLSAGLGQNALMVDHSTVSVAGARQRAGRLTGAGWRFLQAPVFGSPFNVAKGDGLMIVGGGEQTYDASRPTLAQILEKHFWVGQKPEDAAAFKLIGNAMLVSIVEALAESYVIAKGSGINPDRALRLFEFFNPCGTIARRGPRMASGDYRAMFTLAMGFKDVQLMLKAGGDDARMPALKVIERKLKRLIDAGGADLDLAALGIDSIPARGGDAR